MVESLFLEVFKVRVNAVLRDMAYWAILVVGWRLDWMILEDFSYLSDSIILRDK